MGLSDNDNKNIDDEVLSDLFGLKTPGSKRSGNFASHNRKNPLQKDSFSMRRREVAAGQPGFKEYMSGGIFGACDDMLFSRDMPGTDASKLLLQKKGPMALNRGRNRYPFHACIPDGIN